MKLTDPFNGNTSFEYDRVGRRTKRTLPNSVVTEWQYDWRDRVTNITHKISSTTLASVGYERLAGGEPSKITREDGTSVELKYDSALRLTNEVYYTNSVAQTTNSYAYDASGSRIKLVQGGLTLTNSVSGGYQITSVKDAANGNTTNSYAYDAGGRVTSITRDGATMNLGYNTADQVAAVTNGATWVRYAHDASGRRTMATNNGAVRLFMTAPVPGSDLESPHAVFSETGGLRKGYVHLAGQPLCRYDSGGGRVFYLEDGMGSVIGLAPESDPNLSNTSRLFYDGFGNVRATGGPAPSFGGPGIRGDYRFHGQWLEQETGLYHMRAREYDTRMGRFTSRDPARGNSESPETLNPYMFANDNPHVYIDPSGRFTLIELTVTTAKQAALQTIKSIAVNAGKQRIRRILTKMIARTIKNQIKALIPDFGISDLATEAGNSFGNILRNAICEYAHIPENIFFEVGITDGGIPTDNGLNCSRRDEMPPSLLYPLNQVYPKGSVSRPDLIIGHEPPLAKGGVYPKTWLIVEFKGTTGVLYRDYVKPSNPNQLIRSLDYAAQHTHSRLFLIVVSKREKGIDDKALKVSIGGRALSKGVIPLMAVIID